MNWEVVGDCWLWTGTIGERGYGKLTTGGRRWMAHRWVYEQQRGPIPVGMVLDHLCRNRRCVNPAHLEPVTQSENERRKPLPGRAPRVCARGHPLVGANRVAGGGCRTCNAR